MKINIDMIKNEYLGDGVYANVGRFEGEIVLTANTDLENCQMGTPVICLDPSVAKELYRYLKNIFEV